LFFVMDSFLQSYKVPKMRLAPGNKSAGCDCNSK